ncbi:MAG: glycosyltransferase family 2 protein [Armatimonadota bacterium]|nr:MAG: glycosyltransferase family 2 protein [Armatimonadota bacterium]
MTLPIVTLSIVSHGQGALVRGLLDDLACGVDVDHEVVLTLNIPEDERFIADYPSLPITVVRNRERKGFGANHNAAFAISRGQVFVIMNPDIRVRPLQLAPMLDTLARPRMGACAPAVFSSAGTLEDSARRFPTLARLARRILLRRREPDYLWPEYPIEVDWVAGMFMLFRREAFEQVGGFDEGYFMYFEDVDICRRLRSAGWNVGFDPHSSVFHDAQRASRRRLTHLRWHLTSAVRYFATSTNREVRPR